MFIPETLEMILKITLAAVLGMAIGLEREHRRKPAGLRTYTLVALGATLFTILSQNIGGEAAAYDPSRIASQVVVGIGFIGAGIIFIRGGHIEGLTTAAGLWTTAAIGMAVGFGFYTVAVFSAILSLAVLLLLRQIEKNIPKIPPNDLPENENS